MADNDRGDERKQDDPGAWFFIPVGSFIPGIPGIPLGTRDTRDTRDTPPGYIPGIPVGYPYAALRIPVIPGIPAAARYTRDTRQRRGRYREIRY